ncbi:hypothetical protein RFI_31298 [Reticulomyxa filosa]|uniref:Endonuclease/exonuclease/phosphatase domain-containing protein n=1 Tax=Reticulomyxa filosa TaxID=46433 RepID=X6LVY1_RETFI|nr:hypothetical protein RFI_31298 [Reticulomyxa filosa]|eukprot:ETO06098.1 hypothetical protein RFI_31298 [Reticulomyxa filosa]
MIATLSREKIGIIFVYIPPYEIVYDERITKTFADLSNRIEVLDQLQFRILIMGDFNARILQTGDSFFNENGHRLQSLCEQYSLEILNTKFTYKKRTFHKLNTNKEVGSIIDYAMIKRNELWNNIDTQLDMTIIEEFVDSDHFPIKVTFNINNNKTCRNELKRMPIIKITRDKAKLTHVAQAFEEKCNKIKLKDTFKNLSCNKDISDYNKTTKCYDTFMYNLYDCLIDNDAICCNEHNRSNKTKITGDINDILLKINETLQNTQ